jgi:hypothetical protein
MLVKGRPISGKEQDMATARDVAIILVAAETIIIGILLAFLIIQVQVLIHFLREELHPILTSVSETTRTVQGTTAFVSDTVVSPIVRVASIISALRRVADVLTRRRADRRGVGSGGAHDSRS